MSERYVLTSYAAHANIGYTLRPAASPFLPNNQVDVQLDMVGVEAWWEDARTWAQRLTSNGPLRAPPQGLRQRKGGTTHTHTHTADTNDQIEERGGFQPVCRVKYESIAVRLGQGAV